MNSTDAQHQILIDELKYKLRMEAVRRHGDIRPSGSRPTLADCYTEHGSRLCFWFNIKSGSTLVIAADLRSGEIADITCTLPEAA